jgi:hypothetical protein
MLLLIITYLMEYMKRKHEINGIGKTCGVGLKFNFYTRTKILLGNRLEGLL